MRLTVIAAAVLAMTAPSIALARPALTSATPAADASVAKPSKIVLTFSEDLVAATTGLDLVMTSMPGMAHHEPMPIKGITPRAEGRNIAVALPRPLPTGTYELTWHATGSDGNPANGRYSFTVR